MNKPKNWRTGQTIFNFLEWLKLYKEVPANQNQRLADPFHLPDEQWDKYYEEFMKLYSPVDNSS